MISCCSCSVSASGVLNLSCSRLPSRSSSIHLRPHIGLCPIGTRKVIPHRFMFLSPRPSVTSRQTHPFPPYAGCTMESHETDCAGQHDNYLPCAAVLLA